LPFHPLIASGQVLVADPKMVIAYDLHSGQVSGRYELEAAESDRPISFGDEASFTLASAGDCVYARLGASAQQLSDRRPSQCDETFLVCLDIARDQDNCLKRKWRLRAQDARSEPAMFEGPPMVRGDLLYVAVSTFSGVQVISSIECYDAPTGTRIWRQKVCEAPAPGLSETPHRQHLLTGAASNIVYCTHSGAIVAVDASSGRRIWAFRYPTKRVARVVGATSSRDPSPCLFAEGCIFAAPADADRILCLDATTGSLLWESQPIETVNLFGVVEGRLVVTTDSWPRGIRALDCRSGFTMRQWFYPDDGQSELPTLGRGLIAADKLFWPTYYGMRVLSVGEDPFRAGENYYLQSCLNAQSGNCAFGEGYLAIADTNRIRAFRLTDNDQATQRTETGPEHGETAISR
jgi:outer membrane protein assembly factor BamB